MNDMVLNIFLVIGKAKMGININNLFIYSRFFLNFSNISFKTTSKYQSLPSFFHS